MSNRRRVMGGLIGAAFLLATVAPGWTQSDRRAAAALPPTPIPTLALHGVYPNAGLVLEGPYTPPVPLLFALKFDAARRWTWAGTEGSMLAPARPDLYVLDHTNRMQVLSTLVTDELRAPGAPAAQIDGPVDELALLGNGDLLCADYNGDLRRFDDTLFLLDPTGSGVLKGVWYLDDLGCPGVCAPSTNTNVPRDRIDAVAGLAARRTFEISLASRTTQEIYVGQYLPSAVIRQIELTPGTPGTWATRRTYLSPTGDSVDGMDWDPDLQSFWMTSTATGLVYEVALDTVRNTFQVIQAFASSGLGGAIAVTAMRETQTPHKLIEGEGFSLAGSLHVVDSGHIGRGRPALYDPVGTGPVQVGILLDTDCANLPFRVLISLTPGKLVLGDRAVELGVDAALLWTLTDPAFAGTLNASGACNVVLPVHLPPGVGPLHIAIAVFDTPEVNYCGVKRLSTCIVHRTQ
ncbi:MAG: hypothetical protein JXQ29_11845 [Planctomycetes bacterium]|nr:hypothetical protein [Planctomycetota bacterium]